MDRGGVRACVASLPAGAAVGPVLRLAAWAPGGGAQPPTEKRQAVVDFYLFLAAALVVLRQLIQEARTRYRRPGRPTVGASSDAYCRPFLVQM